MSTFLVVDDHAVGRQVLNTLLSYMGHRVLEAGDGNQALLVAREEHPDLIISDIFMPEMDGVEFVRRLREEPALKEIPVIFYTATYRIPDAARMGRDVGVERVIPKPSEPEVILQTINEVLGLPSSERASTPKREGPAAPGVKPAPRDFGLQLASIFDFSFHLAKLNGPAQMLEAFCRGINNLLHCRNSLIALKEKGRIIYCPQGKPAGIDPGPVQFPPVTELLGRVESGSLPFRISRIPGTNQSNEFAGVFEALLVVPFATRNRLYGCVCLTDKLDGSPFSDADEEMATVLSSQAALAYEDAVLIEDLRQHALDLEASNKELMSFSYSIAHDLRAPLRHIAGFAELLDKRTGPTLDGKSLEYLKKIKFSSMKLGEMIDLLLDYSQLGRQEMRMRDVDLDTALRGILESLDIDPKERRIEWITGTLPTVFGEPVLLHSVLQNLISNAVKFTKLRDKAVIEIGCTEGENEYVFFVKDNGAGFDIKFKDKLFGVFQRLHDDTEFEGHGIGLANVKRIISRHKGTVWAESVVGKGSTFYFTLPKNGGGGNY